MKRLLVLDFGLQTFGYLSLAMLPWVALVLAGGYCIAFHLLSYIIVVRSDL